ncbi:hypothetical protein [Nocardia sp. NPDC057030]|uniref:hypothetical protein n=1 Tax=unclassified Nocardia TaxID=2637762 RepID=UPI003640200F
MQDRSVRLHLSPLLLAVATLLVAAGVAVGGKMYLNRSADLKHHVDGTSAWIPHAFLFSLAVVGIIVIILQRGAAAAVRLLLAPLSVSAVQRLTVTVRSALRHPTALLRIVGSLLPIAILLYSPFRMGMQILGGLDPNFTANAWGGPGYLGAMACHYLDGVLLMAAAAYLLNLLLMRATPEDA